MEAGQILVNGAQQAAPIWSPITSSQGSYVQAYQSQSSSSHSDSDYLNNNNLSSSTVPVLSQQSSCIVSTGSRRSSSASKHRPPMDTVGDPVSPLVDDVRSSPAVIAAAAAADERAKMRYNMHASNESANRSGAPTPRGDDSTDHQQQRASPLSSVESDHHRSGGGGSEQQSADGTRFLLSDGGHQQFFDDRNQPHQPRSTVIDYVNHHHQDQSQEQLLASNGNLLFDLKNSDVFGTHHQQLQNAFQYPSSGDYFSSTAVAAAGLTSLQSMAAAGGPATQSIHSIFEYPAAAAAAVMYQQQQQQHHHHHQGQHQVQYVDPQVAYYHHHHQGSYAAAADQQKLMSGQYASGWADATRPLTIQQYASNVSGNGYFPPTPPITSPGGAQPYGSLRSWPPPGGIASDSANFLNAGYQTQTANGGGGGVIGGVSNPNDPLIHSDYTSTAALQVPASPSANSPKECVQCATYDSPAWRRQESGHYLCQNCAFGATNLVTHQQSMEAVGNGSIGGGVGGGVPRGHSSKQQQQPKKAANISKRTGLVCANCHTTNTTLWRRNNDGDPVCNACGLYYKLHHIARPMTMRKEGIQTRKRKPKSGGGNGGSGHHQVGGGGDKAAYDTVGKYSKMDVGGRGDVMDEMKMAAVETRTITTNPYSVFAAKPSTSPLDSVSSFVAADQHLHAPPDQLYGGLLAPFPSVIAAPHVGFHDQHRQHAEMIAANGGNGGGGGGFRVELPVIAQQQSFANSNQFFMAQSDHQQQQWAAASNFSAFYQNSPHHQPTAAPLTPPEQISPSQMLVRHDQDEHAATAAAVVSGESNSAHHYSHSVSNLLQASSAIDEQEQRGVIVGAADGRIDQDTRSSSSTRSDDSDEGDEEEEENEDGQVS